jgi:ubiquinone/menaquinone biosynthesis C-methylase UbiE
VRVGFSSFYLLYLIFTLCFLDEPVKALSEARRVLKKDGMLVVCIVPSDSGLGEEYMRKDSPFYKVATFFPEEVVANMLARTGFKIVGVSKTLIKYADNDFVCYKAIPE